MGNNELHAVKAGIWHFGLEIRKQLMKMYGIKIRVICHRILVFWVLLEFLKRLFQKALSSCIREGKKNIRLHIFAHDCLQNYLI